MSSKKIILLKLTGEILQASSQSNNLDSSLLRSIAQQIKKLYSDYYFALVAGGGNFFRGRKQGRQLGISFPIAHQIGMLATTMNGLIIKDIFEQEGLLSTLFCAVQTPEIGIPISHQAITESMSQNRCLIFTGGTGNPFFTTDTTAVLRGLQVSAQVVWKGTHIDGIYSDDPAINVNATLIKKISFEQALVQNLKIMDSTAFALAKEYQLPIRVFNIFEPDALIRAAHDQNFGSIIC